MTPLNLKATDQGLTMEAKAVLADPFRIMVLGALTDRDGKKLDTFWQDQFSRISSHNVEEFRVVRLKDKDGNVLTPHTADPNVSDSIKWRPLPNGENFVIERDLHEWFADPSQLPDEVTLELRVKQIGETKGTWNWDIPIDLRPAKAATKSISVNQTFTTPQGYKIDFQEAHFGPSTTQLLFTASGGSELDKEKGVRYSLMDEQGTVLAKWDDLQANYGNLKLNSHVVPQLSSGSVYNAGRLQENNVWVHSFNPIDSTNNVVLKLDAVYTKEKADFQAKLPIVELNKKPVTVMILPALRRTGWRRMKTKSPTAFFSTRN